MKKFLILSLLTACILWTTPAISSPQIINDTYWGGTVMNAAPNKYGDMIAGSLGEFQVDGFQVTGLSGGLYNLEVKVTGSYFSNYLYNPPVGLTGSYGPGDLYISSTGWNATQSTTYGHYAEDTFSSTEGWNFVVKGSNWSAGYQLGSWVTTSVYELNFSSIQPTSAPANYVYRANQAWQGGYGDSAGDARVKLDSSGITFQFDTDNLNLASYIGLHWAMKCGNDVVEGSAKVPEPASLFLLGVGLLAAPLARRFNK